MRFTHVPPAPFMPPWLSTAKLSTASPILSDRLEVELGYQAHVVRSIMEGFTPLTETRYVLLLKKIEASHVSHNSAVLRARRPVTGFVCP